MGNLSNGRLSLLLTSLSFYDGGAREKDILGKAYMKLIKHVNSIYKVNYIYRLSSHIAYTHISQIRIAYEWTEGGKARHLDGRQHSFVHRLPHQVHLVCSRLRIDCPTCHFLPEKEDNDDGVQ